MVSNMGSRKLRFRSAQNRWGFIKRMGTKHRLWNETHVWWRVGPQIRGDMSGCLREFRIFYDAMDMTSTRKNRKTGKRRRIRSYGSMTHLQMSTITLGLTLKSADPAGAPVSMTADQEYDINSLLPVVVRVKHISNQHLMSGHGWKTRGISYNRS